MAPSASERKAARQAGNVGTSGGWLPSELDLNMPLKAPKGQSGKASKPQEQVKSLSSLHRAIRTNIDLIKDQLDSLILTMQKTQELLRQQLESQKKLDEEQKQSDAERTRMFESLMTKLEVWLQQPKHPPTSQQQKQQPSLDLPQSRKEQQQQPPRKQQQIQQQQQPKHLPKTTQQKQQPSLDLQQPRKEQQQPPLETQPEPTTMPLRTQRTTNPTTWSKDISLLAMYDAPTETEFPLDGHLSRAHEVDDGLSHRTKDPRQWPIHPGERAQTRDSLSSGHDTVPDYTGTTVGPSVQSELEQIAPSNGELLHLTDTATSQLANIRSSQKGIKVQLVSWMSQQSTDGPTTILDTTPKTANPSINVPDPLELDNRNELAGSGDNVPIYDHSGADLDLMPLRSSATPTVGAATYKLPSRSLTPEDVASHVAPSWTKNKSLQTDSSPDVI